MRENYKYFFGYGKVRVKIIIIRWIKKKIILLIFFLVIVIVINFFFGVVIVLGLFDGGFGDFLFVCD